MIYTHGDHLGSANWITSYNGKPIQYVHYLPYGQLLANQTPYGYDERYKFTGKERDAETGYDYFGARYYWSVFKHWTSVDPLVDNYLHISPYAYCNWNPIKHVDPDGQWAQIVIGAAVSAATDAAIQVGASMYKGNSFGQAVRNIDMRSVAGSAVAGAIGVGVVSKVKQAARIYKLGKASTAIAKEMGSVTGDAIGSVCSHIIQEGEISAEKVGSDVVCGRVGDIAGKGTLKWIQKFDSFKRLTKEAANASRRAEARPDLNKNVKAAEKTANAVENYGANAAQAASSAVNTATTKLRDNNDE